LAKDMDRRVAIITGATSGIGLALARRLVRGGWRVALAARGAADLERLADKLNERAGAEGAAFGVPTDVGRPAEVRALLEETLRAFGRVDALVNNAGLAPLLPIGETDEQTIRAALEVNALGPAIAITGVWPRFLEQRSGRIVNISTIGTQDPFPGFFAYASSKAAVNVMARSCANEGTEAGIRAFGVAPGAVETPMLRGLFGEDQIPREACLDPDDVAALIQACLEGERDGDNGRTIAISREEGEVRTRLL